LFYWQKVYRTGQLGGEKARFFPGRNPRSVLTTTTVLPAASAFYTEVRKDHVSTGEMPIPLTP
jgi:hypothetical protein